MPTPRRNTMNQSTPSTPKRATQSSIASFLQKKVGSPGSPSRQKPARKKRAGGDNRVQITPDTRNSKVPPTPLRRKNARTPENKNTQNADETKEEHMEETPNTETNEQSNEGTTNNDMKQTKKTTKTTKKESK